MENTDANTEQMMRDPLTTQKLIHTYIQILQLDYRTPFDTIIKALKENFDLEIDKEDLLIYFEPTLEEFTEDLMLQFKHVNL